MKKSSPAFAGIDEITRYNTQKVLKAFIDNRVSEADTYPTSGYGYNDRGREKADRICADIFGAQDAIIRQSIACGTHALTIALFGVLRPGDKMLCVTGRPYDTICPVIGIDGADGSGSLADFGIGYSQCEMTEDGKIDIDAVVNALDDTSIRLVYIQRSRGYSLRSSLSVAQIRECAAAAKSVRDDIIVFADNCYGEFAEREEPLSVPEKNIIGADLIAGSLIKNPGGGVARCGGYIAGRSDLVELCAKRMTCCSLGREVGATLGFNREVLMGLYHAPHVVGEAMKTAVFAAALFEIMGYNVTPASDETRHDIIQAIQLGTPEKLKAFCRGIQSGSPVDSFVTPVPWEMPGYGCEVIMASGSFTSGSSIELSADAPLREPFAVWMQGGLNFHSASVGVLLAAREVLSVK